MWKKILLTLIIIGLGLVVLIAAQPAEFHIERTRRLTAEPDAVYEHLADFHKWAAWSPWEKLDPAMKKDLAGEGVGSIYQWAGNDDVGEGRMTILEAEPGRSLKIRLEFFKPWTATNTTEFKLTPEGSGTSVTWAMDGNNNFMSKAFSLVMNMDRMIGKDFEKGLESLDAVTASKEPAEKEADKAPAEKASP
jgi:uncharacterized protein YndB with AHSA1/START domain